jgi:hypothetical protein
MYVLVVLFLMMGLIKQLLLLLVVEELPVEITQNSNIIMVVHLMELLVLYIIMADHLMELLVLYMKQLMELEYY